LAHPSNTVPIRQTLQAALDEAGSLPVEELPGFLGHLEAVRASAWARLIRPAPTEHVSDELIGVDEAADRLHVSPSYLYHHHRELGLSRRLGRSLRFSSRAIENFIQRRGVFVEKPRGKTGS